MKLRGFGRRAERIEPAMAPMIDIVFLLLVFFMLTLKIVEPEGAVSANLPPAVDDGVVVPPRLLQPIRVRLVAGDRGELADLRFGGRSLGSGGAAYDRLNDEVQRYVASLGDLPVDELEAEIDADAGLHWDHTMKALSAVRGHLDKSQTPPVVVPLIEKIKFAPPREPAAG